MSKSGFTLCEYPLILIRYLWKGPQNYCFEGLFLVRVGRLELPASCSQMCVWTFSQHFSALFGPFLCLGSSSLELFCPACFKKPFRLLGFVWDWILCIKRCSARFEGAMTGQSPQNSGAETAPHKTKKYAPAWSGSLGNWKCVFGPTTRS